VMIEMLFYVSLPILFLRIKNIRSAKRYFWVSLFAANVLLMVFDLMIIRSGISPEKIWDQYAFFSFPVQLPFFMTGILCFFFFQDKKKAIGELWRLLKGTVLVEIVFAVMIYPFIGSFIFSLKLISVFIYSILIIFLAAVLVLNYEKVRIPRMIKNAMEYIGKISYSVYLTHIFIFDLMISSPLYLRFAMSMGFYGEFIVFVALSFSLTIAVSSLTYRFIEKPGQRLGNYFMGRIRAKDTASDII